MCGVNVPGIRMVDAAEGVIGIEWIEGKNVRSLLPGGVEEEVETEDNLDENEDADEDPLLTYGISPEGLMGLIGTEIAKMHNAEIIHGDLTTSNMMLRHPSSPSNRKSSTAELVWIILIFSLSLILLFELRFSLTSVSHTIRTSLKTKPSIYMFSNAPFLRHIQIRSHISILYSKPISIKLGRSGRLFGRDSKKYGYAGGNVVWSDEINDYRISVTVL